MAAPTLYLINSSTDQRIGVLTEGMVINLATTPNINIEAAGTGIGSVRFWLDNVVKVTENNPPFAMFGDTSGNFVPWSNPPPGAHAIKATSYSADNASGTTLGTVTRNITIQAASGAGSGIAVPAVKAGWQRVGFSHFDDDIALGSWSGDLQNALMGRNTGDDTSNRGFYSNAEISQHDSLLDCRMRQEANGGTRWMGCPLNKAGSNDNTGAPSLRVTQCTKVDAPEAGWKMAHMVSKYGVVAGCEYDFPEANFKVDAPANAFLHLKDGSVTHYTTPAGSLYKWHTYAIEVKAGQYVRVEFDGQLLGSSTTVTADRVHWIGQNETLVTGTLPSQMGEAHVLTDWITIDIPA